MLKENIYTASFTRRQESSQARSAGMFVNVTIFENCLNSRLRGNDGI